MTTANPFDLLAGDDNDDPSQLLTAAAAAAAAAAPAIAPPAAAKLPTKPIPPAQAVREAKSNNNAPMRGSVGGAYRGGPARGRGGRDGGGFASNPDLANGHGNGFARRPNFGEELDANRGFERPRTIEREAGTVGERPGYRGPRAPYRGGGGSGPRGGYDNGGANRTGEAGGDSDRPPRRLYERHSGTGRGNEIKRDGAGHRNLGTSNDDFIAQVAEDVIVEEKVVAPENKGDKPAEEENKDANEAVAPESKDAEEKEQEDKEMTLEEYEKVREEKRKALLAAKAEERKVELDKELESMKQLSLKKGNEEYFIKLGSDKDAGKKRDNTERAKKAMNINEFLKPVDGGRHYAPGGRGRGSGRGPFRGGFSGAASLAPAIEDRAEFPTLLGK